VPCNVSSHIRDDSVSCRSESDEALRRVLFGSGESDTVQSSPRKCRFIIQPAALVRNKVVLELSKFFLWQRNRDEEHNTEGHPVLWALRRLSLLRAGPFSSNARNWDDFIVQVWKETVSLHFAESHSVRPKKKGCLTTHSSQRRDVLWCTGSDLPEGNSDEVHGICCEKLGMKMSFENQRKALNKCPRHWAAVSHKLYCYANETLEYTIIINTHFRCNLVLGLNLAQSQLEGKMTHTTLLNKIVIHWVEEDLMFSSAVLNRWSVDVNRKRTQVTEGRS